VPQPRMRPPHATITILALCGLAAAAGIGAGAVPALSGASAGPVAAYGFDEGAGARVADASDNSNTGTTSARRTPAGRFGRALRMDRPSEAAIVPDSASLRPPRAVTLEAWVRPDRGGGSRAILVKEGAGRVAYALSTAGGRPQAVVTSGSTAHLARASAPLRPGRWTHLGASYDGHTLRLVVGGIQVARTPAAGRLLTARGPLRIGAGGTGGNRFLGRIDEVRVYGRALTHAELVRDMHRAVRSDPAGGSTTPVIVKPAPTTPTIPFAPTIPVTPIPGDLPGWRQIFTDDFTTDVPSWGECTSYDGGRDCPGLPTAYRSKWWAYPSSYQDTRQKTSGDGGSYQPSNMSMHGGLLHLKLRRVNGVSQSAAPIPKIPGGAQTYGRYAIRFRSDPSNSFKAAWLLWRTSASWGEIDFPESDLDGTISAFNHHPTGQAVSDSDVRFGDGQWHTAVTEWTPGLVRFILDGEEIGRDSGAADVPSTPMTWVIQTETILSGTLPANSPDVSVYIDWVAVWARAA
jgi:hypothetical protein